MTHTAWAGQGVLVAAPRSGAGKTTVTLGLLRALSRSMNVQGAKSGPDYIDPRFHEAATGRACVNLDAWAMTPERVQSLATTESLLVVEGAMGLFDGAPPKGHGSAADLARILGLPVILVVDASGTSQSVAPVIAGFAQFDPSVPVGAVILNNVASPRHAAALRTFLDRPGMPPVIGEVPRQAALALPSRHLGLVQAGEQDGLEAWLDAAADIIAAHVDLDALPHAPITRPRVPAQRMRPPAQTIAMAQDTAFAFHYPHMIADWRAQGAEILVFSPLADDPVPAAEFVFLPGGYPELHAGQLAANGTFLTSLRQAHDTAQIYGECGGYMVLGEGLVDAQGNRHAMAGLLRLETSFEHRKLHLGYRQLISDHGPFKGEWRGHEFHYATTLKAEGAPLFAARDAAGAELPAMGLCQGLTCGSFAHLIDAVLSVSSDGSRADPC